MGLGPDALALPDIEELFLLSPTEPRPLRDTAQLALLGKASTDCHDDKHSESGSCPDLLPSQSDRGEDGALLSGIPGTERLWIKCG